MPTRTFTIYQVPNSYVITGTAPTISATFTMTVSDDDTFLNASAATDTGAAQVITVNGGPVSNYQFFYNDSIAINGGTTAVKTFQLTVGGTTNSYVMSPTGATLPGASVGTGFTLTSYTGYTPLSYSSLPCFVKGTLILTEHGQKPIEDLRVGDMVRTVDETCHPIRWIGSTKLSLRDLIARPHLRPVKISANSLGKARPSQDLFVSAQHRVVLGGWQVALNFGLEQVLTSAKSLIPRDGISVDTTCREVTYYHMMFDRHQIVFSNELPTESFLVGNAIRDEMDQAHLQEILELFPELGTSGSREATTPARPILKRFETLVLDEIAA
ncbi:MAG: Hint domain-containing protein [Alphaproteobacteria bacterium]|nr:Hint domain-containing protein [Alphaproteobacteria bacterium]